MVNLEGLVKHLAIVDNAPFGLLSHNSSATAGVLRNAFGERCAALFSPDGEAADEHPYWRVPVRRFCGENGVPSPGAFDGLGRLVVDLQTLGIRSLPGHDMIKVALEAAAEARLPVTVLDRPIPLGGILDGPVRETAASSVSLSMAVPLCHGMTPGEWAKWVVREEALEVDLTVVKLKGWSHADHAPWPNFMPPSPSLPSWDSAVLYPATLFADAYPALDCDRGGTLSHRIVGAPWLDAAQILDDLADIFPACGLGARPYRYSPVEGLYAGSQLDGILLSVDNAEAFYPVTAGTIVFAALSERYPADFNAGSRPELLDKICGTGSIRSALRGDSLSSLFQGWIDAQDAFLPGRVNLYG